MRFLLSAILILLAADARAAEPAPDVARIEALVRRLGARYLDERQAAREELERIGAPAGPPLCRALDDEDVRIRRGACELLGELRIAAAASRLIDLLRDPDPYVQEAAREALVRIGPPAHDAVRRARETGRIPAELSERIVDRPLRAAVEEALDRCISKDFGWGFYKDQFKDLMAMGPPVAGVLLRLFTTPPADYVFAYEFGGAPPEDPGTEYRKLIIQRLAGEALAEMRDPSVLPDLKAFVARLEKEEVDLLVEDVKGDLYKTAAFILRRLGEPTAYERILATLRKEAGVTQGADGARALSGPVGVPARQLDALAELAMLQVKNDASDDAIWAYRQLIERGSRLLRPGGGVVLSSRILSHVKSAHYNLACALSLAGRKDEAVESLKKAVGLGYRDAEWIKRDRDLDPIREEAGYKDLLLQLERERGRNAAGVLLPGGMPEDE